MKKALNNSKKNYKTLIKAKAKKDGFKDVCNDLKQR